ncbi:MAG: DUF1294 domain-containing protein [Proteobacteria bacterium]|nr:DUF1294 domain-containing protein [Pseudomonadota bacterium]
MMALVVCWLVCANALAAFSFWSDKVRAVEGRRRIPEADLLFIALAGGSPGALVARRLFRHKTRKEPFSTRLMVIVAIQVGAAVGLLIW